MATLLSIHKTYQRHKNENPTSILSERAIRQSIKEKTLSSISSGVKVLICYETFEEWLRK